MGRGLGGITKGKREGGWGDPHMKKTGILYILVEE